MVACITYPKIIWCSAPRSDAAYTAPSTLHLDWLHAKLGEEYLSMQIVGEAVYVLGDQRCAAPT